MAQDFQDLYEYVYTMDYGTADLADIKKWINEAYLDVAGRKRWHWLDSRTNVATTGSQDYYDIAATIAEIYRLEPTSATMEELIYIDPQSWYDDSPWRTYSATEDAPLYYTQFGRRLIFSPIPDGTYTYNAWVKLFPTQMSGDTDEPLIPDHHRMVLAWGALKQAGLRDRNFTTAQAWQEQYEGRIRMMWAEEQLQQTQTVKKVPMPGAYRGVYDTEPS